MVVVEHECLSPDDEILKSKSEVITMKMGSDELGCANLNSISTKTRSIDDDFYTERQVTGTITINGKTSDVVTNLSKADALDKFNIDWEAKWVPKMKEGVDLKKIADLKLGDEQEYKGSLREKMGIPKPE